MKVVNQKPCSVSLWPQLSYHPVIYLDETGFAPGTQRQNG